MPVTPLSQETMFAATLGEPVLEHGSPEKRYLSTYWDLGQEADESNMRPCVRLYVTHDKSVGYTARLRQTRIEIHDYGFAEAFDMTGASTAVALPRQAVARFNRKTFEAYAAQALATVRAGGAA